MKTPSTGHAADLELDSKSHDSKPHVLSNRTFCLHSVVPPCLQLSFIRSGLPTHLILPQPGKMDAAVLISTLQVKELRHREVSRLCIARSGDSGWRCQTWTQVPCLHSPHTSHSLPGPQTITHSLNQITTWFYIVRELRMFFTFLNE